MSGFDFNQPFEKLDDPQSPIAAAFDPNQPIQKPAYFQTRLGAAKRITDPATNTDVFEGVDDQGGYFSIPAADAPDATPVFSSGGATTAPTVSGGTLVPYEAPTFMQRTGQNIWSAFQNTLAGKGLTVADQAVQELQGQGAQAAAERRENQRTDQLYAPMADFYDIFGNPQFGQALSDRVAAGLGQVLGSLPSPETYVGGGLKTIGGAALLNSGVNAGVDLYGQVVDKALGDRENLDIDQAATSAVLGATLGGGFKALERVPGALQQVGNWLNTRRATTNTPLDAGISPEEIAAAFADPQISKVLQASGITPDSAIAPRAIERVQARRASEAQAATPEAAAVRAATDQELAAQAAADLARAEQVAQKAQTTPVTPLTPEEVQASIDANAFPLQQQPDVIPVGRSPVTEQTPALTPQERTAFEQQSYAGAPDPGTTAALDAVKTRADLEQRQTAEAFTLAERQAQRNVSPEIRDTQTAGVPEGIKPVAVTLDEGNPVRVIRRESGVDAAGRPVDLAVVRRYDPRTNEFDPTAPEYPVRADMLKQGRYTPEPRRAQDFGQRAQGPKPPEQPRQPNQPVSREPVQTFRQTPKDPNEDFPGAQPEGRSPLPPNTEPPPSRRWSTAEEVLRAHDRAEAAKAQERASRQRAYEEAKARGEQAEPPPREGAQAEAKYRGKPNSNAPRPPEDGRYATDEYGYMLSDKGTPIKFADQKQTARFIVGVAQKNSEGQVFEIANHPTGGFTVKTADMDAPSGGPKTDGPESPPNDPPPGERSEQRSEQEPRAENTSRAKQSDPEPDAPKESFGTRQSNTMGSNQFLEPLIDAVGKAIGNEAAAASRAIRNAIDEVSAYDAARKAGTPVSTPDWIKGAYGVAKAIWLTKDGEMRGIQHRTGSKTIKQIADMFHSPVGGRKSDSGVGATFYDDVNKNSFGRANELENVLTKEFGTMTNKQRDAALDQVAKLVRDRAAITDKTNVGRAAKVIANSLDDFHAYLKKSGMELGEVKNYFPRVLLDDKVLLNPDKFKDTIKRAYMADGLDSADATFAAEAYYKRISMNDMGVDAHGNDFVSIAGGGRGSAEKARVFSDRAEKIIDADGWYLNNPAEVLPRYFYTMSRRAEWIRRMGPKLEKWQEMKAELFAERKVKEKIDAITDPAKRKAALEAAGLTEKQLEAHIDTEMADVVNLVSNLSGLNAFSGLDANSRNLVSTARAASSLMFLAKTAWLQLSEPALMAVRTGRADDALRAYVGSVTDLIGMGRKDREIAEALGIVEKSMGDMVSQLTGGPIDVYGRKPVVEAFFKQTGQYYITNSQRVASTKVAAVAIKRWAREFEKNPSEGVKTYLREVGIPDAKMAEFAKWAAAADKKLFEPSTYKIDSEMNNMFSSAVIRMVDQVIQRPNRATRPRWAEHPLGSLAYSLTSFSYTFQKNVLNRVGTLGLRAVSEKGLTTADRARLMTPALMLGALWAPLAYAVWELRAKAFEDKRKPIEYPEKWFDYGGGQVERFVNATGVAGVLQSPLSMMTGIRYDRDPGQTAFGPLASVILEQLSRTVGLASNRNSKKTNTAERAFANTSYQAILQPLMAAAVARAVPVGTPLLTMAGGALQQAAASPTARMNFTDTVAGKARRKPKRR